MTLRLGSTAPGKLTSIFNVYSILTNILYFIDFKAQTTKGDIQFHEFIGDKWTVLFSHPADFSKFYFIFKKKKDLIKKLFSSCLHYRTRSRCCSSR